LPDHHPIYEVFFFCENLPKGNTDSIFAFLAKILFKKKNKSLIFGRLKFLGGHVATGKCTNYPFNGLVLHKTVTN
jgi:hypothetical protein